MLAIVVATWKGEEREQDEIKIEEVLVERSYHRRKDVFSHIIDYDREG